MTRKITRLTLFALVMFLVLSIGGVTAQTNIDIFRNIRVRNNATILGNLTVSGTTTQSGVLDLNGQELTLDADADTSITADTDDQIDIEISGADDFVFTANLFESQTGSVIDLNGTKLELDADADTSITADTDDQIDIEISGADDFIFTANLFESQTGSVVDLNGTKLELDADADTSITADTDDTIHLEIGGSDIYTLTATIFDFNAKQLDLDADDDTSITASTDDQIDFEIGGADEVVLTAASLDLNNTFLDQDLGTENLGSLPTVCSLSITYTVAAGGTGTVCTIAASEIWFIHAVFAEVTTNWDATGDDVLVEIGDGSDTDGLLDLDDAELQAADVEGTGAPAGWQGFMSTDTRGAYLANGHGFIYNPGGTETIDYIIDETSGETITAGALTVYVVYTRLQ